MCVLRFLLELPAKEEEIVSLLKTKDLSHKPVVDDASFFFALNKNESIKTQRLKKEVLWFFVKYNKFIN